MEWESLPEIFAQYRSIHEDPNRYRGNLQPYFIKHIAELVNETKAKTMLDYGSGKGEQYTVHKQHKAWGIKPTCYDPGYPPHADKPSGYFDGVICTDVLEHVPPQHVKWVLRDTICFAKKFVFLCIFTEPAKAKLPDGRNAHLTVQPAGWWLEAIEKFLLEQYTTTQIQKTVVKHHTELVIKDFRVMVVFRTKANKNLE